MSDQVSNNAMPKRAHVKNLLCIDVSIFVGWELLGFFSLIFLRWISDSIKFCFLSFKKNFAIGRVEERTTGIKAKALERP